MSSAVIKALPVHPRHATRSPLPRTTDRSLAVVFKDVELSAPPSAQSFRLMQWNLLADGEWYVLCAMLAHVFDCNGVRASAA